MKLKMLGNNYVPREKEIYRVKRKDYLGKKFLGNLLIKKYI